jgi:hypothetical protein
LGQLLKIALEFKMYFWHKLKPEKIYNINKTTYKQVSFLIIEVGTTAITIDNHMAVIQV